MTSTFTILFVCTGNVCRSPFAEILLRERLGATGSIRVQSAGTAALVAAPMNERMIVQALAAGLTEITEHHAEQLTGDMIDQADLVLALDRSHRREIVTISPRSHRKTVTLREFQRLCAVITDDDITADLSLDDDTHVVAPRETAVLLRTAVATLVSFRGIAGTPMSPADDDVVDPYERTDAVFAMSAQQMVPAVHSVADYLHRVLDAAARRSLPHERVRT